MIAACALAASGAAADDDGRAQYPGWLADSYISVGIGHISYPFSREQLEPGQQVESIETPHAAVRLALLGHRFGRYFSAQLTYMRPVLWVRYKNVNGLEGSRTVWMNIAGFTGRVHAPLHGPLSMYAEGGLGIVTRSGFKVGDLQVVKDANYANLLLGGGLDYRLSPSWDLGIGATYSPPNTELRQPHTLMVSGGFTYTMRPLPEDRVAENARSAADFPANTLQIGYATSTFGTGVNRFVSAGAVPIFWGGNAVVRRGASLHYHRNVFHTRKVFSFDVGASVAYWRSDRDKATFYTASLFPVFQFTPLRTRGADFYIAYSLAGPTTLSRVSIDGWDTGRHFTFQDFMGVGMHLGRQRNVNAEVRIGHYSNGNLFPQNAGVTIPLTFNLGYAF